MRVVDVPTLAISASPGRADLVGKRCHGSTSLCSSRSQATAHDVEDDLERGKPLSDPAEVVRPAMSLDPSDAKCAVKPAQYRPHALLAARRATSDRHRPGYGGLRPGPFAEPTGRVPLGDGRERERSLPPFDRADPGFEKRNRHTSLLAVGDPPLVDARAMGLILPMPPIAT